MSAVDELLARHRSSSRSSSHASSRTFSTALSPKEVLGPRPRLRVAVLTCMDCRIDIEKVLGLRRGDVHVLRNVGGVVTDDVLRSLVVSQRLLGTDEVMVVMHSQCGMLGLRDADLAGRIGAETRVEMPFAFGGFADTDEQLRASVEALRTCPPGCPIARPCAASSTTSTPAPSTSGSPPPPDGSEVQRRGRFVQPTRAGIWRPSTTPTARLPRDTASFDLSRRLCRRRQP